MIRYEVAVNAPINHTLTYGHPETSVTPIPVGSCVLVPLGNRKVTGYVLDTLGPEEEGEEHSRRPIKPIAEVFEPAPFFPEFLIPLYRWVAEYYHHPLGEVIKTALPAAPSAKSGLRAQLTDQGRQMLAESTVAETGEAQPAWLRRLLAEEELSPSAVTRIKQDVSQRKQLESLIRRNYVALIPTLIARQVKPKKETVYALAPGGHSPEELLAELQTGQPVKSSFRLKVSEQKALTVFLTAYQAGRETPVGRKAILGQYRNGAKALTSLCEKGIITQRSKRLYRDPFGETIPTVESPLELTEEQNKALKEIIPAIEAAVFQPFLLFGVTGCGKTEVYLRAAEAALQSDKSALILVPEIALATQLEAQFYSRFGEQLALFHSGLTPGERADQWQRVVNGIARVVLGARSAVFAPLHSLGVIIVDEEHEPAYKQEDGARYNGRDVAVMRAKQAGCPILLGTATPSITTYHNAAIGKYRLLTITKRVEEKPLPTVEVVDLSGPRRSRHDLFFSDELIHHIGLTLDRRQQVLLFVNRRGFSSSMLCRDCGHIVQCRHCHVSMTYHRQRRKLLCHYCGYSMGTRIVCPQCHSENVAGVGLGAERIEEEAKQLFPAARVARLDSDVAGKRKRYLSVLKEVRSGNVDILVGTQMIAKGLHFPDITLVGVIWADAGFSIPDYKAAERTYALLSQVTGRAGRGVEPGKVIIQTSQPEHYAIVHAKAHDYASLYETELASRAPMGFPPFSRLINILFSGTDERKVEQAARKTQTLIADRCRREQITVLGPSPSPVSKIKDRYRWQLLLQGTNPAGLHRICSAVHAQQRGHGSHAVRVAVDVDPESMM